MIEKEKLQKAIETAIAAGYQLSSEAFEFLSQNSETTDPLDIVNIALQKLANLQDKPFFIDRIFLEALMHQLSARTLSASQPQQQQNVEDQPIERQISSTGTVFYPHSKDIKADLNIIEDSKGKLSSNGTLEE